MSDKDDNKDDKNTPEPTDKDDNGTQDTTDYKSEAEKWKALARKHEKEAKARAQKLQEIEDADKTEVQKATDKLAEAEKRAKEAEVRALRLEVAGAKGLSAAQAKRLVGSTKEELEADADEFLESIKSPDNSGAPPGKPKENLRGGGAPDDSPIEMDPDKLAAAVPRR